MRTTVDIPDTLLKDARRVSLAKTKTMTIILGLQELINRHRLDHLRSLRGTISLTTDLRNARAR